MKRNLPPLHSLRVFEAAARHLSFTNAAQELNLTQGAVSRQVRALEDYLGKRLFERLTRQVVLTEEGRLFLSSVQRALNDLERTVDRIQSKDKSKVITVSILPTLASLWLMPRLASFTQAYKGVEIRIITSIDAASFATSPIDLAIRCGGLPGKRYERHQPRVDLVMVDDWRGLQADLLFPDRLVPVLSKRLASQIAPITTVADLRNHRLVHTASRASAWPDWLRANQVEWKSSREDVDFGHFFMSLQAARDARGIAIVPTVLLANYEGRGEMLMPFPPNVCSSAEYYLISRADADEEPHIRVFRNWLMAQASDLAELA